MADTMNASTSIEANLGNVSGQVAFGNYNVQISADHGAVVNLSSPERQPIPRPHPSPVLLRPRRFAGLVDRLEETGAATTAFRDGAPVEIYGEAGLGKTALLRYLAYEADATGPSGASGPAGLTDGVVYLSARSQPAADLLQCIFDAFYECDVPFKPNEAQLRSFLQGKRSLILLDDVDLQREELERVIDIVASSCLAAASNERRLWGEIRSIALRGLPLADALILVEREMGRALNEQERAAATDLCSELEGHPLRILQAVAGAREEHRSLVDVVAQARAAPAAGPEALASLAQPEREVLGALAALNGAPVQASHVASLAGLADAGPALNGLLARKFIAVQDGRYGLTGDLLQRLRDEWDLTAWRNRALEYFTAWAERHGNEPESILESSAAIRNILEWAVSASRWNDAIRLGRAVDGALTQTGRWGASSAVLELVLAAARAEGHSAAQEAWALHQIGSRALCLQDKTAARTNLSRALELRQSLGDLAGAAVTRHNLNLLLGPAPSQDGQEARRPLRSRASRIIKWATLPVALMIGVALYTIQPGPQMSLAIDPINPTFQSQVGQGSAPLLVTVSNKGSRPVQISGIEITGPQSGEFEIARQDCTGGAIAPGRECSLAIVFNPVDVGSREARLDLTIAGRDQHQSVMLTGASTSPPGLPSLALNPNALVFKAGAGEESPPQNATVKNSGAAPVKISRVALSPAGSDFKVSGCEGVVLAPGQECEIAIAFKCPTLGPDLFSANLNITPEAGQPLIALLTGMRAGTAPRLPAINLGGLSPFGETEVGSSPAVRRIAVSNVGTGTLGAINTNITAGDTTDFKARPIGCNSVPPGGSCNIEVSFAPTKEGKRSATINVTDETGRGLATAPVQGVGTAAGIQVSPPSVDFGNLDVGQKTKPRSVTIVSAGSAPLKMSLQQPGTRVFSMTSECGNVISPGEKCSVTLNFDSSKPGEYSSTLLITSNARNGTQTIPLRAKVRERQKPAITLRPPIVEFKQPIDSKPGPQIVTIINSGGAPLVIDAVTITGPGARRFAASADCNSARLLPKTSCQLRVAFSPAAGETSQATLTVTDRADGLQQSIPLVGVGPQPKPVLGYCCTDHVFSSSPEACDSAKGNFFKTQIEASKFCAQKNQPETGFCCVGGALLRGKVTLAECARQKGAYYTDLTEARRLCRKIEPRTDWCCLPDGVLLEGMNQVQCRERKGSFLKSKTKDEASALFQPIR